MEELLVSTCVLSGLEERRRGEDGGREARAEREVEYDAGESWNDETYDLRAATGAIGQIRPSALLFVPVSDGVALLAGASNGVYVQKKKSWTRLGACSELPQVLVAGLSYEADGDVVVAATMGRGVYVMHNASSVLDKVLSENVLGCSGVAHHGSRSFFVTWGLSVGG